MTASSADARKTALEALRRTAGLAAPAPELSAHGVDSNADSDADSDSDGGGDGTAGLEVDEELAERLRALALGGALRLEDLPPALRRQFLRAAASGRAVRPLQPWQPWWVSGGALVEELGGAADREGATRGGESGASRDTGARTASARVRWRDLPQPLPAVRAVTRAAPAPAVAHSVAEALFAFAATCRLFNGDWDGVCEEAASVLLSMAAALRRDERHACTATALHSASAAAREQRHFASRAQVLQVLRDAESLARSREYCVDAMLTAEALLDAAAQAPAQAARGARQWRREARLAARKARFLAMWCADVEDSVLQRLADEIAGVVMEEAAACAEAAASGAEGMGSTAAAAIATAAMERDAASGGAASRASGPGQPTLGRLIQELP